MSFPKPFYRWRPHPWHGLDAGLDPPGRVQAYIEVTPFDGIKYEVECSLATPDGRNPCIRTVWISQAEQPPRLITAHPLPKSR